MNKKINVDRLLQIIAEESIKGVYDREREYQEKISKESSLEEENDEEEDPLFKDEKPKQEPVGDKTSTDMSDKPQDEPGGDMGDLGALGGDEPEQSGDEDIEAQMGAGGADGDQGGQGGDINQNKQSYIQSPLVLELGKVTFEGVGATLNLIRSGRSFKDADVAAELETWFKSLSQAEQLALATFLEAIKDISEGEKSTQTPDPSDPSIGVQMTTKGPPQIRPGGIKKPGDPVQQNGQQQVNVGSGQQNLINNPNDAMNVLSQINQAMQGLVQQNQNAQQDLEDTDAPIVVGKRNESIEKEFRKKIKEIISRT